MCTEVLAFGSYENNVTDSILKRCDALSNIAQSFGYKAALNNTDNFKVRTSIDDVSIQPKIA